MAGLVDRIANMLMPEEEYEEVIEEKREIPVEKKIVQERPVLTVHTNHVPELKMKVYKPKSFDQVNLVADILKAKEAVVVNYEEVSFDEQRRLCDFLNGVAYIIEGSVHRVSATMVVYTPANVEISKDLCSYSIPTYMKQQNG